MIAIIPSTNKIHKMNGVTPKSKYLFLIFLRIAAVKTAKGIEPIHTKVMRINQKNADAIPASALAVVEFICS